MYFVHCQGPHIPIQQMGHANNPGYGHRQRCCSEELEDEVNDEDVTDLVENAPTNNEERQEQTTQEKVDMLKGVKEE